MRNSPFHDSNARPLPDANDIERILEDSPQDGRGTYPALNESNRSHLAADRRRLRNFLIGLLVTGLLLGGALSIGVVWMMGQLNLTPASQVEPSSRN